MGMQRTNLLNCIDFSWKIYILSKVNSTVLVCQLWAFYQSHGRKKCYDDIPGQKKQIDLYLVGKKPQTNQQAKKTPNHTKNQNNKTTLMWEKFWRQGNSRAMDIKGELDIHNSSSGKLLFWLHILNISFSTILHNSAKLSLRSLGVWDTKCRAYSSIPKPFSVMLLFCLFLLTGI